MKKSAITQELANTFPSWSKTRTDDQSVGYQFLNALALPFEKMDKELARQRANYYLTTANLDEVDILYKVNLPLNFTFDQDIVDPFYPQFTAPIIDGYINSGLFPVTPVELNTIEAFWYASVPNRYSVAEIVSGETHELLSITSAEMPHTGMLTHHLGGGAIHINVTGGTQYVYVNEGQVERGMIILTGKTRKGTIESENIVFPWDQQQPSLREWEKLTKIETVNIDDIVTVTLTSANFVAPLYLSAWNNTYSDRRRKVDDFWALGEIGNVPTLDHVKYVTDEWQQLLLGFTEKEIKQSWQLLDNNGNEVNGIDLAVQPFSDKLWIITTSGMLYCYDARDDFYSNISLIQDRTVGSNVKLDFDFREVVSGEDFTFIPWHARPLKEIIRHRIWYQDPSGNKSGLLNGTEVAYSSNFWIKGAQFQRTIGDLVSVTADETGEWLFVLEVVFIDGEEHTERVIASVKTKTPLVSLDISETISGVFKGVDFDSNQRMWLWIDDDYHRITLHKDIFIVDFDDKILYFHEDYDTVEVVTDA